MVPRRGTRTYRYECISREYPKLRTEVEKETNLRIYNNGRTHEYTIKFYCDAKFRVAADLKIGDSEHLPTADEIGRSSLLSKSERYNLCICVKTVSLAAIEFLNVTR